MARVATVPQSKTVALGELTRAEREVGEIVAFGDEFYVIVGIDADGGRAVLERVTILAD